MKLLSSLKNKIIKTKENLTTSKKLIIFLFANCTVIELFTMAIIVWDMMLVEGTALPPDFSPLVALIGAIVGEAIGYAVYSLKSMKENCKGGIVYQQAMLETEEDQKG